MAHHVGHRLLCATLAALLSSFLADATTMERRHEKFVKSLEILGAGGNFEPVVTVNPTRVTRSGQFLEYASLGPLSVREGEQKMRRRRSLDARDVRDEIDAASATAEGDHEVFFDLGHAPGTPLSGAKLHLKRNYKLVSRNFLVEERARGGKLVRRHSLVEDCHYKGVIHNHDSFSKVALSLCNGLQGIIVRDDDTYFIEPAWNHTKAGNASQSEEGHPHVILKRSVLEHLTERRENEEDLGHCGYSDKVAGETPWWKIDPRDLSNKKGSKDEDKEQEEEQSSSSRSQGRRHHHHHHRTSAGRSAADEQEEDVEEGMAKSRRRRSVSVERHVEVMVVADKMMVGFHGRKDVEKYILTIMNIVSNLYHDSSIGNAINIVVTRVVLLTEDQPGLEINHHADQSLNSFCRWQSDINVNQSDFGLAHHDNAILITGFDICTYRNQPCGTLGLAPVSGMCEHMRSCSINEDIGLASAFTIAHEIGHNFGMNHDGTGNDCGPGNGQPSKIMAPQMTTNTSPFMWSRCSKKYITEFLDSGAGECLVDTPPSRDFDFPEEMPGQLHDADEQCRFQYGPQSKQCRYGDVCRELWCTSKNERCATNSIPAAEGTNCQTADISRGWCYRGNCVPFGYRPQAVDGSWGSWSAWAECSRTCGTGISSSSRSCDSPAPEHGGKYCIGERMRYRSCNTQPCSDPNSDPRREYCASFDTQLFRGKYYNWLPYTGSNVKACALNCLAQGFNFFAERAAAVVDGTRCFSDSLDVCINGECHHVGCDHVLHSNATEDKCRVCGGDGSTCETQAGIFNMPIRMHGQYHQVVTIPRGSVNILVQELEISKQNYIALKNTRNEDYVNGGWTIDWPQKFKIAGTTFTYKRPKDAPESLEALGPTTEDLIVMLLVQEHNRGLRYEYNVPIERESSGDANVSPFLWSQGEWTPCTASCAGGTQRRPVECRRVDDDTVVQPSYCDQTTKPVEQEQSCNVEACPPIWSPGKWGECSRTCGGGHRTRQVLCMRVLSQIEDEVIDGSYCTGPKPPSSDSCNHETCPPQWTTGRWSSCKPRCGPGTKTREVECKSSDRRQTFPDERCDIRAKPAAKAHCNSGACPPPRWVYGKWGKCSAQCGHGTRRRRVFCAAPGTNTMTTGCPTNRKPKTVQTCVSQCSAEPEQTCQDDPKVAYCRLVLRFKFCNRAYFRKMCCSTCSRG